MIDLATLGQHDNTHRSLVLARSQAIVLPAFEFLDEWVLPGEN